MMDDYFIDMDQVDVEVSNHGSIFTVVPLSEAAQNWVKENIPEDAQYLGPALAVDHRFIEDLIDGMQSDGLVVNR